MKIVDGKKMSQNEINMELVRACHDNDLSNVVNYVGYGADVNATDSLGYCRAIMYALDNCSKDDNTAELIIKYLVQNGADINFRHGDKNTLMTSRPYFIQYVASNPNCSDELVYILIKKGGTANLEYVPTNGEKKYISALDEIKAHRPLLYKKLLKEKLIETKKR